MASITGDKRKPVVGLELRDGFCHAKHHRRLTHPSKSLQGSTRSLVFALNVHKHLKNYQQSDAPRIQPE
jgi:hypothetical protein